MTTIRNMATTATAPRRRNAGAWVWSEIRWIRYSAITTMPLAKMAATLVVKRRSAPSASWGAPDSSVSPTTAKGGTRDRYRHPWERVGDVRSGEGNRADRARGQGRHEVDEPWGDPRCHLAVGGGDDGVSAKSPMIHANPTTTAAPTTTSRMLRRRFFASVSATASTIPRIGVISGATIMAPITVAVESLTTPAAAMTADGARAARIG